MATSEERCDSLLARLTAVEKLLDEREERNKDRFAAMEKNVTNALAAADKAVAKAEITTEKRFEGINEFRETLRDQANTLMPRVEYEVQHKALGEQVQMLATRLNSLENLGTGKNQGLSVAGQIIIALVTGLAAIGAVLVALFRH